MTSAHDHALPDIQAALRLFDETTHALEARARRLEEVITVKQRELVAANEALEQKVDELARLQAYTELVLTSVPSGVIAVDTDGRITTCNPTARRTLAGINDNPEGACYADLFADAPLLQVLANGQASEAFERQVHDGHGRPRILLGHATPIHDGDGVIGAVETFDDITELRDVQDRLQRAERLKALGEMAAGVAHEIRNPLNGIEGFASLLQRDLAPDSRSRRYADAIVDGVRHLNRTVTGLLAFTRPKQPQRRPVPAVELATSCVELVRAEAVTDDDARPSLALRATRGDDDERWPMDPTQMRQVLLNLIQNAVQMVTTHRGAAGHVVVQIAGDADELVYLVDDDGPGVSEADRGRIFTPFYTTRDDGTGLGLAVAHTMVQLHGGNLDVSDSPAGGARFRVVLPR